MSNLYVCDFCGFETKEADGIQTSNILHLAKNKIGKDVDCVGALLPGGDYQDYCNGCYRKLKDWLNGGLRQYIRDQFPLKKVEADAIIH